MSVTLTIDGADRVEKMLREYPGEMGKLIKKAMRRAAKPHLATIRGSVPFPEWKSDLTIKAKVVEKKGRYMLTAGVFGVERIGNKEIPAYYKWLWRNYGTLQNRDPNHSFKTKIKNAKGRRNNIGQPATGEFERITAGAAEKIAEDVRDTIENSIDKFEKELNNR